MDLLSLATATLVFCAPGYPGGAQDAQPYVSQFASAAALASGWTADSLGAVYDPTEEGGLAKLASPDAALAFVPFPFFVEHVRQLHLAPIAQADVSGVGAQEKWTLVAKTGGAASLENLGGYTIVSVAGYAPDFVRRYALGGAASAATAKIEPTAQILSALRRVAAGEKSTALLDQTQFAALPTLPFASGLKAIHESVPLPVAIIAVVDGRLAAPKAEALQRGLLKLSGMPQAADSLRALRLQGFVAPRLPAEAAKP